MDRDEKIEEPTPDLTLEKLDASPDMSEPQPQQEEVPAELPEDELAKAQALVEEFKEALQRERADFQNYRKRMEKERDSLRPTISAEVIKRFLPVVDDFERALDAIPEDQNGQDWVAGIIQIHRKFHSILEAEGIGSINPVGEPFDPNYHEAIGADEPTDEIASGHVTVVLQKGYAQGDRVLRPAIVKVAN